jgi:predicted GIY-YIG superfamily endonuclease
MLGKPPLRGAVISVDQLECRPAGRAMSATRTRRSPAYYVYIVRCADGSLYTGLARDPEERVALHNAGRGAKYTCSRRPVALVYQEAAESRSDALKRESEIKHWRRARKDALIAGQRA